jgi:maltose alpha-D-glucosyltransferase/alpha-amylase
LQQKARPERLKPWALRWLDLVTTEFLDGYQATAAERLFAANEGGVRRLLAFRPRQGPYEIGYELNYRPDFLQIPLSAVNRLVEGTAPAKHHRSEKA